MTRTAIKVISMESSTQRRADFIKQVSGIDIEWSFFPAYTSIAWPLTYDEKSATRRFGRALSRSEIGCYTSHFKCWEWLINSDYDQGIFFEDDVIAEWKVIQNLSKINMSNLGIDFLRLYATQPFKWRMIKYKFLSARHYLIRTQNECFGFQSYLLSKAGARQLVALYTEILFPVDWLPARHWEHGLIDYALFPFPIIERSVPSTIADRSEKVQKAPLTDRIFRLSNRIVDRLKRLYGEIFLIHRWPLGHTKVSDAIFIARPHSAQSLDCERERKESL